MPPIALSFSDLLNNPTLRVVALGSAALGVVSGVLGSFAVLRRQSLLGDAVSHAALPGIALAFLLFSQAPLVLILGATVAGWVATTCATQVVRHSSIPFDTALAGVLSVFFGFGLVLMSYVQRHASGGSAGLERYLFGQAATMLESDLHAIAGIGALAVVVLLAFWKEMKLLAFDPDYAATVGLPVRLLDMLLTTLLVLAIVIGLQSVGVVLMSAMVVAPAAAARQWTDRLGHMVVLAAVFGGASGVAGTLISDALSGHGRSVPTGPTIVLCASALVLVSLVVRSLRSRVVRVESPEAAGEME